jgi:hypothetical protein
MVSSITSVRVWTQQVALKAFNEAASERGGGASGPMTSLADRLSAGASGDGEDSDLSNLLATLRQQAMTGGAKPATDEDGAVEDISSDAFMKALQQKIDALAANPDTKAMAELMQKALKAGTLTITDAEGGEQIVGREVAGKEARSGETTAPKPNPSPVVTKIETSDWSDYLKDHLKRDTTGKYMRNEDTSHIDKMTGASSYFGMIGDTYYYLSWNDPKDVVTIQAPRSP